MGPTFFSGGCLSCVLCSMSLIISVTSGYSQVSEEWLSRFIGLGVADMAVDKLGNVYVTGAQGSRNGEFDYDLAVVSFDNHGNLRWSNRFSWSPNTWDVPDEIVVDNAGNVYVAGWSDDRPGGESNQMYLTIKWNANGTLQWARRYDGAGANYEEDVALALTVDNNGNVYVTGTSEGADLYPNATTVKYDSNGVEKWVALSEPGIYSLGEGVAVDVEGSVYRFATTAFYNDVYIFTKYDSSGKEQWTRKDTGSICLDCIREPMVFDDSLYIYLLTSRGIVKYNTEGIKMWTSEPPGMNENYGIYTTVPDPFGNLYAVATATSASDANVVVIKYDSSGKRIWKQEYIDPSWSERGWDLWVDSIGNIYALAWSNYNNFDSTRTVTLKYDKNGAMQWVQAANIKGSPTNIGGDNTGGVYVSINSNVADTIGQMIVIKYSESATPVQYGLCCFDNGSGPKAVCGPNVTPLNCLRSGENAFFAGYFDSCSVIDTINICAKKPAIVRIDASYDEVTNAIELNWQHKTSKDVPGYYVQRSTNGKQFKTIGFVNSNPTYSFTFKDPYPEIENYYRLIWFDPRGYESNRVLAVAMKHSGMQIYPNPGASNVRIVLKDLQYHNAKLTILDAYGRVRWTRIIQKGSIPQLPTSSLTTGVYLVLINVNGKTFHERFVKK